MKIIDLDGKKYHFLISGGTGFIGSKLCEELLKDGQKITVLTRQKSLKALSQILPFAANFVVGLFFRSSWMSLSTASRKNKPPKNFLQKRICNSALNHKAINYINDLEERDFDYDVVINLCGESISQRWSKSVKKRIYDSRIKTTKLLVDKIINSAKPLKLFISGSAIGYYGTSQNTIFQETSQPTSQNLFSQKICFDLEKEAKKAENKTRVVLIRTGIVIGKSGGIIKKMLLPFKLGLGGKIASGEQMMSWIHIHDMIGAINHIINHQEISGAINMTSPNYVSNLEFSQSLARSLKRPCFFTIPAISMKLIFGKMADELLINGQKIYPRVLLDSGYKFKFENITEALREV